jgi:hypothetical protein
MRATHHDLIVETGATLDTAVRFHQPDAPVAAGDLAAGDWVYYDGTPWPVYAVRPRPATLQVDVALGTGLWWQPVLTLDVDAMITSAVPQRWDAVACKYLDVYGQRQDVPTSIDTDGVTLRLLPATQASIDWSLALQAQIEADTDKLTPPPVDSGYVTQRPRTTFAYDLVATFDGVAGSRRILQGTLTLILSTSVDVPALTP